MFLDVHHSADLYFGKLRISAATATCLYNARALNFHSKNTIVYGNRLHTLENMNTTINIFWVLPLKGKGSLPLFITTVFPQTFFEIIA